MHRMLVLGATAATAIAVEAHEGHGLALPHLHTQEWLGLLFAAAVGAGMWWWSRRDR